MKVVESDDPLVGITAVEFDGPNVRLEAPVDEPLGPIVFDENACPKCFHVLSVGEYPFCPHGFGSNSVVWDEIPGGMVMDHVEVGRKVYSRSELKAVLAAKGWKLSESKSDHDHAKFLKERGEYAGDTQKERDRERLQR